MNLENLLPELRKYSQPKNLNGMKRYGIRTEKALGVPIPQLRKIAKKTGKNHKLALQLWQTEIHEARILASMIAVPQNMTEEQMDEWVKDFNSWDLCDQCCNNLFGRTKWAHQKIFEWSASHSEFIKRAGFVLLAVLAVHDKSTNDNEFKRYLHLLEEGATDERNFVKKAVNWALRQIGKRNKYLNYHAIKTAQKIQDQNIRSAKWIASDALRELTSEKIQLRLTKRSHPGEKM
jgi:3-methyladenine DNA glycosylase AlkD